jgi:hypothetical protein
MGVELCLAPLHLGLVLPSLIDVNYNFWLCLKERPSPLVGVARDRQLARSSKLNFQVFNNQNQKPNLPASLLLLMMLFSDITLSFSFFCSAKKTDVFSESALSIPVIP